MSKAARNRRFRRQALIIDPTGVRTKGIARALRRHGRMPLDSEPHTLAELVGLGQKRRVAPMVVPKSR